MRNSRATACPNGDEFDRGDLLANPFDDHADCQSEADVETLLASLPDDLRRAGEIFRWGGSMSEAARAINLPLSTLRDRLTVIPRYRAEMGVGTPYRSRVSPEPSDVGDF